MGTLDWQVRPSRMFVQAPSPQIMSLEGHLPTQAHFLLPGQFGGGVGSICLPGPLSLFSGVRTLNEPTAARGSRAKEIRA